MACRDNVGSIARTNVAFAPVEVRKRIADNEESIEYEFSRGGRGRVIPYEGRIMHDSVGDMAAQGMRLEFLDENTLRFSVNSSDGDPRTIFIPRRLDQASAQDSLSIGPGVPAGSHALERCLVLAVEQALFDRNVSRADEFAE